MALDEATVEAMITTALAAQLGPALAAEMAKRVSGDGTSSLKLEHPPTYSGNLHGHSPKAWLYKLTSYFDAANISTDANRLAVASYYLNGAALSWWRMLDALPLGSASKPSTWEEFKEALIKNFEDANPVEQARDRLATLQQRTSVRQYAMMMRNTSMDIPGITNEELKDRFLRGLKQKVREEVRIRAPATFEEAVQVAERYDTLRYNTTRQSADFFGKRAADSAVPMELGAVTSSYASGSRPYHNRNRSQPNSGGRERLTPELRQQLLKEGKCFYCREPGHVAAKCPKRPKVAQHGRE